MTVHFAQIREDAAVELDLVARHRPHRIACIGSGGCTALSLLTDEVEVVWCVDANPAQCAVVELKRAALAALDREDWLAFVGERPHPDRAGVLAGLPLPAWARAWWEAHPTELALGANHCGTTERFYRFVGQNLRASVVPDEAWWALLRGTGDPAALRDRWFSGPAWETALRVLLSRTTHTAFFPPAMFANVTEHDFAAFFAARFDEELETRPLAGNYFLSQLLFQTWLPDAAPPFVADWERTRRNLHKLVVVPRPIEDFLDETEDVDALFLSNVFDWLDAAGRERLCRAVEGAAAPGAVVLWRNMLAAHPLPLAERLVPDDVVHDRSMLYRHVTAGVLP